MDSNPEAFYTLWAFPASYGSMYFVRTRGKIAKLASIPNNRGIFLSNSVPINNELGILAIHANDIYIWYTLPERASGVESAIKAKVPPMFNLLTKFVIIAKTTNHMKTPFANVIHRYPIKSINTPVIMYAFL